jgi:hypothetical protein
MTSTNPTANNITSRKYEKMVILVLGESGMISSTEKEVDFSDRGFCPTIYGQKYWRLGVFTPKYCLFNSGFGLERCVQTS